MWRIRSKEIVRKERRYGEYVRRFYVQNIAEDQIVASLKDGVLKLDIPKRPNPGKKRIQIRDDIYIYTLRSLGRRVFLLYDSNKFTYIPLNFGY